jgi:hypothetical protein
MITYKVSKSSAIGETNNVHARSYTDSQEAAAVGAFAAADVAMLSNGQH